MHFVLTLAKTSVQLWYAMILHSVAWSNPKSTLYLVSLMIWSVTEYKGYFGTIWKETNTTGARLISWLLLETNFFINKSPILTGCPAIADLWQIMLSLVNYYMCIYVYLSLHCVCAHSRDKTMLKDTCHIAMTLYMVQYVLPIDVWWRQPLFYNRPNQLCRCISLHGCLHSNTLK